MGNELSVGCNDAVACADGIASDEMLCGVPPKDDAGVGITCRTIETEKWGTCVEIVHIAPGGPAELTGKFQAGDLLYSINGMILFKRPMDYDLMQRFKGVAGSSTQISVLRRSTGDIVTGIVTRPKIGLNKRGNFGERHNSGGNLRNGYTPVAVASLTEKGTNSDNGTYQASKITPTRHGHSSLVKPVSPTRVMGGSETSHALGLVTSPRSGVDTTNQPAISRMGEEWQISPVSSMPRSTPRGGADLLSFSQAEQTIRKLASPRKEEDIAVSPRAMWVIDIKANEMWNLPTPPADAIGVKLDIGLSTLQLSGSGLETGRKGSVVLADTSTAVFDGPGSKVPLAASTQVMPITDGIAAWRQSFALRASAMSRGKTEIVGQEMLLIAEVRYALAGGGTRLCGRVPNIRIKPGTSSHNSYKLQDALAGCAIMGGDSHGDECMVSLSVSYLKDGERAEDSLTCSPRDGGRGGVKLVVLQRAYDGSIGLQLGETIKNVGALVTELESGWPAEESGEFKVGDVVMSINRVTTDKMAESELAHLLVGPPHTDVSLLVMTK